MELSEIVETLEILAANLTNQKEGNFKKVTNQNIVAGGNLEIDK